MSGLLSREAAAEYLGVSTRTLDRIRAAGDLAYVKLGGRIAYLAEDLDAYVRRQRVGERVPQLTQTGTWRRRRTAG